MHPEDKSPWMHYNMREHNEPSDCEAGIWRMCANHDEAERNHGVRFSSTEYGFNISM